MVDTQAALIADLQEECATKAREMIGLQSAMAAQRQEAEQQLLHAQLAVSADNVRVREQAAESQQSEGLLHQQSQATGQLELRLQLQVEKGVELRRSSEHELEVEERLERAQEELRVEKAASEVLRADLTFAEEASVFLRADFEKVGG